MGEKTWRFISGENFAKTENVGEKLAKTVNGGKFAETGNGRKKTCRD